MTNIEAQFSPDATPPEPVVGWISTNGRPPLAGKEATTTNMHGTAALDDLMLQIKPRRTWLQVKE
jgi:hypothetical protein